MSNLQLSMFRNQQLISVENINETSIEDINREFKRIDIDTKNLLNDYTIKKAGADVRDGNIHYWTNYIYNYLKNNHQNFYAIFSANNDNMLVTMKKVRMNLAQYNRIIDFPTSYCGNTNNEDLLLDKLFDSGYIQQAFIPTHRLSRINTEKYDILEIQDNNFYTNTDTDASQFTNKFLTKSRVKMMMSIPDFSFCELTEADLSDVVDLYNAWYANKEKVHSGPMYRNYINRFSQITKRDDIAQYGIKYKGKLMAFVVFTQVIPGYYYKLMQFGYRRNNAPNKSETLDKIISQIGQILHYYFFEEARKRNVKFIACAGAYDKNLMAHKEQLMPHCIKYHRVKLKSVKQDIPNDIQNHDE